MTIIYLSGNSLTGLSGDIKPSNVPVNSTFLETDTNKTFKYTGSSWVGLDVGVGDSVSNAELDGSIGYGKLNLTGTILNTDLAGSIAYGKLTLAGTITNADLAGSIAISKLANGTAGKFIGYNDSTGVIQEKDSPAGSPTGVIAMFAGTVAGTPAGWLLCDGTAISRTTYSSLFTVISTQHGVGNGSTTFNLPNLLAKFPRGAPSATNAGGTGGADTHTLTVDEMPSHAHVTGVGVRHSYYQYTGYTAIYAASNTTGGDQPHNNMPSYVELLFIIKT